MKSTLRLVIVFGSILFMSIPIWAEVINVCINTRTGAMRNVEDPSDCRRNENHLEMNTEGPAGSDGTDGINCWDLNGNGACDTGEDINSDGVCTVADCQGPPGPPGQTGGFDLSKIYVNYCGGELDDGVRVVECLCDDDGSIAISGSVSCGQLWYPITSGPFWDSNTYPDDPPDGWTALCKNLLDQSQFGPDVLGVLCIRP